MVTGTSTLSHTPRWSQPAERRLSHQELLERWGAADCSELGLKLLLRAVGAVGLRDLPGSQRDPEVVRERGADHRPVYWALEGRELGEYAVDGDGTQVTFAPALEGNPFAKMLLLGAVLVGGKEKVKRKK